MGTVSIVMPVYNGSRYLKETLLSIVSSLELPDQLVLIDDGSDDGSGSIAREFLKEAAFDWQIFTQLNQGEAKAVNKGVSLSTSDYIVIINADDPIEPELIGFMKDALDVNPDKVVAYPDWTVIDGRGRAVRKVKTQEYSQDLLFGSFVCIPGPGAFIRRTAIMGELRDTSLSHVADYGTWLTLGTQGDFVRVPRFLANWREHGEGQTSKGKGVLLANQYVALMTLFFSGLEEDSTFKRYQSRGMASAHYQAAIQSLFGPGVAGRRHLFQAINLMSHSDAKLSKWPFAPKLVALIFLTPVSRWVLNIYYQLRS